MYIINNKYNLKQMSFWYRLLWKYHDNRSVYKIDGSRNEGKHTVWTISIVDKTIVESIETCKLDKNLIRIQDTFPRIPRA